MLFYFILLFGIHSIIQIRNFYNKSILFYYRRNDIGLRKDIFCFIWMQDSSTTMSESNIPGQIEEISNSGSVDETRGHWSNQLQSLTTCIAMSIGLGNVWRFPYTAYTNGGGAFLIPYFIVLLLVGKPLYFLEIAIGQFSSRGSIKVYDFCPGMRGKKDYKFLPMSSF